MEQLHNQSLIMPLYRPVNSFTFGKLHFHTPINETVETKVLESHSLKSSHYLVIGQLHLNPEFIVQFIEDCHQSVVTRTVWYSHAPWLPALGNESFSLNGSFVSAQRKT